MGQSGNNEVLKYHQKRREELRSMTGEFKPTEEELERQKQAFLAQGGVIKKLFISSDSVPNVWGDFVKSRIRAT